MAQSKTKDLAYIAVFAVIIAVCSWISIPSVVPFTLQTFGVFLTVGMLGGRRGTAAILIYILLGIIGLPVFSNFTGGIGVILGTTGGYIVGFVFSALIMWAFEKKFGSVWALPVSMTIGLIVCYAFGTAWFMIVYARTTGAIGLWTALMWCVIPYLIPDAIKIILATLLVKRLSKLVKL